MPSLPVVDHRPSRFASFVGVDLHKCSVTLVAVNPAGEETAALTAPTKCVQRIADWLKAQPRPCHMAVETVGFVEWFIERFRSCVDRIDIAHATELAHLRGKRRKNDHNDALDVGQRLSRGQCPLGWLADDQLMQLRKLGRHWHALSRTLSRAKHCMRSILLAANLAGPHLDSPCAQKWFLAHSHLLHEVQRQAFADFLDVICLLERQRESLRRRIFFANRQQRFVALVELLKSLPGIDEIWACIIAAEIGDFTRFPNADALQFWAGLTPDNLTSAGRTQAGHITKAGSRSLRWALGKAALTLCRSDARQEALRQRLIQRVGKPKANVAMARRLLGILFAMVRDGCIYQGQEPTGHERKANQARLRRSRALRKEAA